MVPRRVFYRRRLEHGLFKALMPGSDMQIYTTADVKEFALC